MPAGISTTPPPAAAAASTARCKTALVFPANSPLPTVMVLLMTCLQSYWWCFDKCDSFRSLHFITNCTNRPSHSFHAGSFVPLCPLSRAGDFSESQHYTFKPFAIRPCPPYNSASEDRERGHFPVTHRLRLSHTSLDVD